MYKIWTIYFAQTTESKRIRIGRTTRDVEKALASLKSPEPLVVLKTVKGTLALIRDLHEEFESLALEQQTQWYTSSPELLSRIEAIEDFDGSEPPKPKPEPKYEKYESEDITACCGCGRWLDDEFYGEITDFLTLDEDESYIDWGEIHDQDERMDAYASSKCDNHYLCSKCVLKGGLTNLIYRTFYVSRTNLSPFWTQTDEEVLSECVNMDMVHEKDQYVWVKARIFTRKILAQFFESNPSGDMNAAKLFIIAFIRTLDSTSRLD